MTYSAKVDAELWLAGQRTAIARAEWSPATPGAEHRAQAERAQTFGAYAADWTEHRDIRVRTREEYRRLLRGPLASLSGENIAGLTSQTVRRWFEAQLATGSRTQAARAYGLLSSVLKTAVDDGLLSESPAKVRGAQTKSTGKRVEPPTSAELATILATITPRYRALVALAAAGGLRYGEATALRGRDVTVELDDDGDVDAVRVIVEKGAVRTAAGIVEGSTKSEAGVRKVAIFGSDAKVIATRVLEVGPDELLFAGRDGGYLPQSTFHTPHWRDARRAAGRDDLPFHALRHYAGTRYAQSGATVKETMQRLGHSSPGASMRYQHATDRDDELARRMARGN